MSTIRPNVRYKDFYNDLNAHPVRKDLFVLQDTDAVKNSIKNLVFTNPRERFFNPSLGSGIRASLFENMSAHTAFVIQTQIEATIINFEPRANLIQVVVTPDPDLNGYYTRIIFSTINNPEPTSIDVLLTRVR